LSLIGSSGSDHTPWRDGPFVDSVGCTDMTQTVGVDLQETGIAELLDSEGG
jgi:hypothetical protein